MNMADEFSADVMDVIADVGGPATITRLMASSQTPDKFDRTKRTPPVYQTINTFAATKPITTKDVEGTLARNTVVYMVATPREGEKVSYGGSSYVVQSVSTYSPQGQDIYSIVVLAG